MTGILTRLVSAAVLLVASGHAAFAVTIFVERSLFEAAVTGPLVTDTFNNDIDTADVIVFDSGTTSTKSSTGVPPTLNRVAFGQFTGFVQRDGFRDITFDFPLPVTAFGGDFSSVSSLLVGSFDGTSMTLSISDALAGDAGFFGVVSDDTFSSISFSTEAGQIFFPGGPPVGGETFNLDNFTIAPITIAPIPLPASLPLLVGALVVLGGTIASSRHRAPDRA